MIHQRCFPLNFHFLILEFVSEFCLQQLVLSCSIADILFHFFLLNLLVGILKRSVPSPTFIYLFFIYVNSWIFILFWGLISNIIVIYLATQIISALAIVDSLGLTLPSFWLVVIFFLVSLLWTSLFFRNSRCIFSSPAKELFFQKILIPFIGELCSETKIWTPGVVITILVLLGLLRGRNKEVHTHIYTHKSTYTHINFFLYLSIWISIKVTCIHTQAFRIQTSITWFISILPLLIWQISFTYSEKLGFHYLYLLINPKYIYICIHTYSSFRITNITERNEGQLVSKLLIISLK